MARSNHGGRTPVIIDRRGRVALPRAAAAPAFWSSGGGCYAPREPPVDLRLAVAISMLPVSRGPAAAVFKALRREIPDLTAADVLEVMATKGVDHRMAADEAWAAAGRALLSASRLGVTPIAWFDPRYPSLLNTIADPPPVLWVKGCVEVLGRRAIAVVGSRAATSYALDVGFRLGSDLADRGAVVVSGLARGVDSAAHRGCLEAAGSTIAVLGSGVDRIYPAEHESTGRNYRETWGLVSELAPGAPPLARALPPAEPHHQRDLAGRGGRRSQREERVAHHRPVRHGAGARRHGRARQRPLRPQPRITRPIEGWRKGRRDGTIFWRTSAPGRRSGRGFCR
jgi:hypothetical protein